MPERIENRMVVDSEWAWQNNTPSLHCDFCGCGIYSGEYFYDFDGDIVCEECIDGYTKHYRREAE